MAKRIDWVGHKARLKCASTRTPLDLEKLCADVGIRFEWRRMVPEGTTVVDETGATIYLQSNFRDDRRTSRRLRFTFAHEICHALFFDDLTKVPKALPGTPKGAHLEKLCQQGAAYLLAPTELLPSGFMISSADDLTRLGGEFDVSLDALIRRIHEVNRVLPLEYALLLVRRDGEKKRIDAFAAASLPHDHLKPPDVGEDFGRWSAVVMDGSTSVGASSWSRVAGTDRFEIKSTRHQKDAEIVEIQRIRNRF